MPKRIIICCDGTWNTPEKDITNVVKTARAVRPTDARGIEQVVFYDWGVGTQGKINQVTGGALGEGVHKNIQLIQLFTYINGESPQSTFLIFINLENVIYLIVKNTIRRRNVSDRGIHASDINYGTITERVSLGSKTNTVLTATIHPGGGS